MRALAIAAGVIAVIVIGFFVLRGPSPVIAVAPEHIFDIGPLAVTNTMFTSWIVVILMSLIAFFAGRRMFQAELHNWFDERQPANVHRVILSDPTFGPLPRPARLGRLTKVMIAQ